MKVRVFAPAFLDLSALDNDGYVTLPEGSDVGTLLKKLKIPFIIHPIAFYTVNNARVKAKDKLKDGDTVTILALAAGG